MPIVLTDVPELAARLCGCDPAAAAVGEPIAPDRPGDRLGVIWNALAPRRTGYRLAGPPTGAVRTGSGDWDLLVVIDAAPSSQFDVLRDLAGRPHGLPAAVAAVALTGDGFHGHRGRSWSAARGNLHLSLGCRLDLPAASCALALTAVPAVAVIDAVRAVAPTLPAVGIKWVNDILASGRKIAGVLTATQSERQRVTSAVFGIGLNVAQSPEVVPTLFVPQVGCLHDLPGARSVTLAAVLTATMAAVSRRLVELARIGPEPLLAAYRTDSLVVGQRVRVWAEGLADSDDPRTLPPPLAAGRVAAIGADLALLFEGQQRPITQGRLAFETVCRRADG